MKPIWSSCGLMFLLLSVIWLEPVRADHSTQAPGGFLEPNEAEPRPRWDSGKLQSFIPAERGKFSFPAPYHTEAVRLTIPEDCRGKDCVRYVGYSYWRNINNHVNSDEMLIFLTLMKTNGGPGPTLFRYDKRTDRVTKVGPLFDKKSRFAKESGEGWYFSGTMPTKLYMNDGPKLLRYDVITKEFEKVFDVTDAFGNGHILWQPHSSDDDRVHSVTLQVADTSEYLGCLVYFEQKRKYFYYKKIGTFDECHLDKSGRWAVSLEDIGVRLDLANRIFDNETGKEIRLSGPENTLGHMDMGYGYMIGADGYNARPGATILWTLDPSSPTLGPVVHYNPDWKINHANHPTHANAKPGVPPSEQYACGSNAGRESHSQHEIICFRLDGSPLHLVVAPVMVDLDASGGWDDYAKLPKGNLDVTGQYFIWTANLGGDRLDAFIVKVPAGVLYGQSPLHPAEASPLAAELPMATPDSTPSP